jgi:hypothetical protein
MYGVHIYIVEGSKMATRGGEWEPIKIPQRNLAYVPKSTQSRSLLTRLRPSSYRQAISLRNWARNCNKDSTQKQFISSQAFHRTLGGRVREPTVGERFRPRNLKTLDPTTQRYNRASPAIIHTQEYKERSSRDHQQPVGQTCLGLLRIGLRPWGAQALLAHRPAAQRAHCKISR